MAARARNLIAYLASLGAVLVVYDYMTGAEWAGFVGSLIKGLIA